MLRPIRVFKSKPSVYVFPRESAAVGQSALDNELSEEVAIVRHLRPHKSASHSWQWADGSKVKAFHYLIRNLQQEVKELFSTDPILKRLEIKFFTKFFTIKYLYLMSW